DRDGARGTGQAELDPAGAALHSHCPHLKPGQVGVEGCPPLSSSTRQGIRWFSATLAVWWRHAQGDTRSYSMLTAFPATVTAGSGPANRARKSSGISESAPIVTWATVRPNRSRPSPV